MPAVFSPWTLRHGFKREEQWGTDGYTIFGGYYDNAYYPCKRNVLCPAQTKEEQIRVPHFKLLGCDPIYQYDCYLWADCNVYTLEPWKFDESKLPAGNRAELTKHAYPYFVTFEGGQFRGRELCFDGSVTIRF